MLQPTCPFCGGIIEKRPPLSLFHDQEMFHEEDAALMGCLCYYTPNELEQMIAGFDQRFSKMLKERFPGKGREEIIVAIQKMSRNAPIRAAILSKLGLLQKAKERVKVIYEYINKAKEKGSHAQETRDAGLEGKPLGMMDWLSSFKPVPDEEKS